MMASKIAKPKRAQYTYYTMLETLSSNLFDFAAVAANPQEVKRIVEASSNFPENIAFPVKSYWDDLMICEGYPSGVIFFATLSELYPDLNFDAVVHSYILCIKESIEISGLPRNSSLYCGLAGLCYAIRFGSKNENRYQKMLAKLEAILFLQIRNNYILPFRQQLAQRKSVQATLYETVLGPAGIGLYLLQIRFRPEVYSILGEIIELMIGLTHPIKVGEYEVPGWYVSVENQFNDDDRSAFPEGSFNIGLSHGITGVLSFLSIASLQGINFPGQKEAIETISVWLRSKSAQFQGKMVFKSCITWQEQISGFISPPEGLFNREAWCYGTAGVARTLYLAGKALQNQELKNFSMDAFKSIFERPIQSWKLTGPTFCHGISGLLLITHFMAKDSRDSYLVEKKSYLEEEIQKLSSPNSPFSFTDFQLCVDGSFAQINLFGLLTGATGVWLSLLTMQASKIPNWYSLFAIHDE